jgi:hypothetical protein
MEINNTPLVEKPAVLAALAQSVAAGGNQLSWCKQNGVSPAYLSDVLSGRREPGPKILDVLGLEPVTVYRPKIQQGTP